MTTRRDFLTGLAVAGSALPGAAALASPASGAAVASGRPSLADFGAVGDGTTDDTKAIFAALAAGVALYSPAGTYRFDAPFDDIHGRLYGLGQIKATDGITAPYFSTIDQPPKKGSPANIRSAFSGDISRVQFAVGHRISGKDTLGHPKVEDFADLEWDRLYTPEAYPHYTYLQNESGHNDDIYYGVSRTVAAAHHVRLDQFGQGDAAAFSAFVNVSGQMPGSLNVLSNASGHVLHGQLHAKADGVFLEPVETLCFDDGYDVGYVGNVVRGVRTNDTGAKHAAWVGYVAKAVDGDKSWDAFYTAYGSAKVGIDFTQAHFDEKTYEGAAIALKAGDGIYFDATAERDNVPSIFWWYAANVGGSWIKYDKAAASLLLAAGGTVGLTVGPAKLGFYGAVPREKPVVAGSRSNNPALASLLKALETLGLIINKST